MHSWAFIINKFYVNISFNIPILSQKVLPFLQNGYADSENI